MIDKSKRQKNELLKAVKREQKRNYIILYVVTFVIWLILLLYSFLKDYFTTNDFIVNVVNNIIGIIPPILIFDFFNEKLSRDSSAIELSNKITEALMSNSETLELFTEEQRKVFIRSAITSIVKDQDATEMVNDCLNNYLDIDTDYRIRTEFDYNFELNEKLPMVYDEIFTNKNDYFYVQEKLHYKVKCLSCSANNINTNQIKIGFLFDNKSLDSVLREKKSTELFDKCIFREKLDIKQEDIEKLKSVVKDKVQFQKLFKLDVQIDSVKGIIDEIYSNDEGFVCTLSSNHDIEAMEHTVRIIFHMPKQWNSILEVALVDPTKAPKISVSYPEDMMNVDMFSFLSKGEESSVEVAHEHLNGIYDITINNEWIYPISGMVFWVNKKNNEE